MTRTGGETGSQAALEVYGECPNCGAMSRAYAVTRTGRGGRLELSADYECWRCPIVWFQNHPLSEAHAS